VFLFFSFSNYFFAGNASAVGTMFYPEWASAPYPIENVLIGLGATSIFAIWMSVETFPSWIPAVLTGFVFSVAIVLSHHYARWKSHTVENFFQLTQKISGVINVFFFLGKLKLCHVGQLLIPSIACAFLYTVSITEVMQLPLTFAFILIVICMRIVMYKLVPNDHTLATVVFLYYDLGSQL
jgi:hypothetical protein